MEVVKTGQTDPNAPPAASGSGGNGAPSAPAGTGKKTYEEVVAENESLRGSVKGMAAQKSQWDQDRQAKIDLEAELEEIRARNTPAAPAGDDLLTPEEVAAIDRRIDARVEAREADRTAKAERTRKESLAFKAEVDKWRIKAKTDFPDSLTVGTPLYKRATEIYLDPANELATFVEFEGQKVPIPASHHAEYDAIARASAELQSKGAVLADGKGGAAFAGTGGPGGDGGSPAARTGEVSDEEYNAMTPEQKNAYKEERFNKKFPGRK